MKAPKGAFCISRAEVGRNFDGPCFVGHRDRRRRLPNDSLLCRREGRQFPNGPQLGTSVILPDLLILLETRDALFELPRRRSFHAFTRELPLSELFDPTIEDSQTPVLSVDHASHRKSIGIAFGVPFERANVLRVSLHLDRSKNTLAERLVGGELRVECGSDRGVRAHQRLEDSLIRMKTASRLGTQDQLTSRTRRCELRSELGRASLLELVGSSPAIRIPLCDRPRSSLRFSRDPPNGGLGISQ